MASITIVGEQHTGDRVTELPAEGMPEALRWLEGPLPHSARRRARVARVRARRLGRPFWLLWTATAVSSVGDGLVVVALPLLAATITRNPLALGAVLAALRLPWLFVALPLGAIADRTNRRRMASLTEAFRAALLVGMAVVVAAGVHSIWFVYVAAVLLGSLEASFIAATSSAVPDLVDRDHLARANGRLFSVNVAADDFLGVGIGGLLFVAVAALPFLLDGVSFVASALLLCAALPRAAGAVRDRSESRVRSCRTDVRDGLRLMLRAPSLRILLGANAVLAFFQAVVMGLLIVFGLGSLGLSKGGYGVFLAVAALGAVVGGWVAGKVIERLGGAAVLVAGGLLVAFGYVGLAASASTAVALVAWTLVGFFVIIVRTAIMSMRQERVPDDMQARTNTAFRAVVYGVVPLGAIIGGAVATALSVRWAIGMAGAAQVVVLLAMWRPIMRALEQTIDLRVPEETGIEETIDLTSRLADFVGQPGC